MERMNAHILASDVLQASLVDVPLLRAELSDSDVITAQMNGQEILHGNLAPEEGLTVAITIPDVAHEMPYTGDYTVTPLAHEQTVLKTKGRAMTDDVTVLKVPYYEVGNQSGDTVYIASEV